MTQAATTHTNTPRRAHPAVVRAALRSRSRYTCTRKGYAVVVKPLKRQQPRSDTNNQLSTVNLPTGFGSITFNSYQWTVPSQITLPGGTVRNQQYDGLLRLKTLAVKDPGQSQVLNYQYNYDLTNNITTKATEAGTTNYSYDTLDRLTGANYTGQTTAQAGSTGSPQANEAYSYDQVANRLTDSRTTATWIYDANNQLASADNLSYTYDANGNTLSQTDSLNAANTRNYVYDADNRLTEVRDRNNTLIAVYRYDPFGRRLSKDTGNTKTYFFYNAEGLIAEADATGVLTKSYGYEPGSTFSTNPLWLKTGNAYYTYQNDHLGTPMKVLNQSGLAVWSATYDSFGKATVDPASTVTNNLRFPGQYADQETGLHYNWMRYYDPRTGRYVSEDKIDIVPPPSNLYQYANQNSIANIDSFGLWASEVTNVHQHAGELVFGKELTKAQMEVVSNAHHLIDSKPYQDPKFSYMHAMSAPGEAKAKACRDAEKFVRAQFQAAWMEQSKGKTDRALTYFTYGLHTLQDSTSPSHKNFQVWEGHPLWAPDSIWHMAQEAFDLSWNSELDSMTQNAWSWYKSGQLPPDIFKCWKYSLVDCPNNAK